MLAVEMSRRGYKVGVLDADINGPSIPKALNIQGRPNGVEEGMLPIRSQTGIDVMSINLLLENDTDPVIWRGPILGGVVKQFWTDVVWKDIDYLFVDMPPGTGDCDQSTGTRIYDRKESGQYGRNDEHTGYRIGGELQLSEMSRLRKGNPGIRKEYN